MNRATKDRIKFTLGQTYTKLHPDAFGKMTLEEYTALKIAILEAMEDLKK